MRMIDAAEFLRTGMQVDAVKSVAMPITWAGSMPASLTAAGTVSASARV